MGYIYFLGINIFSVERLFSVVWARIIIMVSLIRTSDMPMSQLNWCIDQTQCEDMIVTYINHAEVAVP